MIYIPSPLIDENNLYSYHDNIVTVYSDCEGDLCTCHDLYPSFDYNYSHHYNCSKTGVTMLNSTPTDNYYYRQDFWAVLFIFLTFCFVILYCPIKIILRFFKRFN